MPKTNYPIWIMSSAYDGLSTESVLEKAKGFGAQGVDLCVFRNDGERTDHVATHLDYEGFSLNDAKKLVEQANERGLKIAIGAFENLIGGEPLERERNQDHLLKLIRIAHLLGGNDNGVNVGTFVGYNHELGNMDRGFERNVEEYAKIFGPIVQYAEDLNVTILYENCPMEGWQPHHRFQTFNNLAAVLAARKLMYELIPSKAHGEIYDPSHDIWQHNDPVQVMEHTDMQRLKRVHVKATRMKRNLKSVYWGNLYPAQAVDAQLAKDAGIPIAEHDWDRYQYEAMMPGFGGNDDMDWRTFIQKLIEKGFSGAFELENEGANSKSTNKMGAIDQGFEASILFLAPMLWPLTEHGYQYDRKDFIPMQHDVKKELPKVTMKQLLGMSNH